MAEDYAIDNPASVSGRRECPPADVVEYSDGPPHSQDKRRRADALCLAFVAHKEVANKHSH